MEWNTILLWISGSSCLITIITALRASPRMYGWVVVCLAILAAGGVAYILKPEIAGLMAGSLWAILALAPALLQKSAGRWGLRQDYDRAARFAQIAGFLHPFDGVPQQTKFLQALALAERGEMAAATSIMQHLEKTAPTRIARLAAVHHRRLAHDWPGILAWIRQNVDAKVLLREPNLLPMYVRALGETGDLAQMLRSTSASRISAHPQLAAFRTMCRMFAFVFCGHTRQAMETFGGALSNLPVNLQEYWLATARCAAGLFQESAMQLDALEPVASPALRLAIHWRKENPPALASSILTDADLELLDRLDREQEHEQRFAHSSVGRRRPWVTHALILANVIMFGIEWMMGATHGNWVDGGTMSDPVLHRLGDMESTVLQTHEYYRLFMANFLHFGYAHIVMNMLALWILGPFVEFTVGRLIYLVFYLFSGVAVMATVLFLQLHNWMDPRESLVGASGAIMAIIGATAAILFRGWYRERAGAAQRRLFAVGAILVLQVTFDHFTPQVSGAAHIAGVLWGFLLATVLRHGGARKSSNYEISNNE